MPLLPSPTSSSMVGSSHQFVSPRLPFSLMSSLSKAATPSLKGTARIKQSEALTPIYVALRVYPSTLNASAECLIRDGRSVYVREKKSTQATLNHYFNDRWVEGSASQEEVYVNVGRPLVQSVINGCNGCVLFFGARQTGKTHSFIGSPEDPGIVPRFATDLFTAWENGFPDEITEVAMTFVEIEGEKLWDLLNHEANEQGENSDELAIVDHPYFGPVVPGLLREKVQSAKELISYAQYGQDHRKHEAAAILSVRVDIAIGDEIQIARVNFVDLPSSNPLAATEVPQPTKNHNHADALGPLYQVVQLIRKGTVSSNSFRQANLTYLLKLDLNGHGNTRVLAHVRSGLEDSVSTLRTLQFSKAIMDVKNAIKPNARVSNTAKMPEYLDAAAWNTSCGIEHTTKVNKRFAKQQPAEPRHADGRASSPSSEPASDSISLRLRSAVRPAVVRAAAPKPKTNFPKLRLEAATKPAAPIPKVTPPEPTGASTRGSRGSRSSDAASNPSLNADPADGTNGFSLPSHLPYGATDVSALVHLPGGDADASLSPQSSDDLADASLRPHPLDGAAKASSPKSPSDGATDVSFTAHQLTSSTRKADGLSVVSETAHRNQSRDTSAHFHTSSSTWPYFLNVHGSASAKHVLPPGKPMTVGSSANCDICIQGAGLRATHCIARAPREGEQQVVFFDGEGVIWVNGKQATQAKHNDSVVFGQSAVFTLVIPECVDEDDRDSERKRTSSYYQVSADLVSCVEDFIDNQTLLGYLTDLEIHQGKQARRDFLHKFLQLARDCKQANATSHELQKRFAFVPKIVQDIAFGSDPTVAVNVYKLGDKTAATGISLHDLRIPDYPPEELNACYVWDTPKFRDRLARMREVAEDPEIYIEEDDPWIDNKANDSELQQHLELAVEMVEKKELEVLALKEECEHMAKFMEGFVAEAREEAKQELDGELTQVCAKAEQYEACAREKQELQKDLAIAVVSLNEVQQRLEQSQEDDERDAMIEEALSAVEALSTELDRLKEEHAKLSEIQKTSDNGDLQKFVHETRAALEQMAKEKDIAEQDCARAKMDLAAVQEAAGKYNQLITGDYLTDELEGPLKLMADERRAAEERLMETTAHIEELKDRLQSRDDELRKLHEVLNKPQVMALLDRNPLYTRYVQTDVDHNEWSKQKQRTSELRDEATTLRAELDVQARELVNEKQSYCDAQQSLTEADQVIARKDADIDLLTAEIVQLQSKLRDADDKRQLAVAGDSAGALAPADTGDELERLQALHDKEMEELAVRVRELAAQKVESDKKFAVDHEAAMAQLRKDVESHTQEQMERESREQIDALLAEHDAVLKRLEAQLEEANADRVVASTERDAAVQQVRDTEALAAVNMERDAALQWDLVAAKEALATARAEHDAALQQMQSDLADAKKALETVTAEHNDALQQALSCLAVAQDELATVSAERDGALQQACRDLVAAKGKLVSINTERHVSLEQTRDGTAATTIDVATVIAERNSLQEQPQGDGAACMKGLAAVPADHGAALQQATDDLVATTEMIVAVTAQRDAAQQQAQADLVAAKQELATSIAERDAARRQAQNDIASAKKDLANATAEREIAVQQLHNELTTARAEQDAALQDARGRTALALEQLSSTRNDLAVATRQLEIASAERTSAQTNAEAHATATINAKRTEILNAMSSASDAHEEALRQLRAECDALKTELSTQAGEHLAETNALQEEIQAARMSMTRRSMRAAVIEEEAQKNANEVTRLRDDNERLRCDMVALQQCKPCVADKMQQTVGRPVTEQDDHTRDVAMKVTALQEMVEAQQKEIETLRVCSAAAESEMERSNALHQEALVENEDVRAELNRARNDVHHLEEQMRNQLPIVSVNDHEFLLSQVAAQEADITALKAEMDDVHHKHTLEIIATKDLHTRRAMNLLVAAESPVRVEHMTSGLTSLSEHEGSSPHAALKDFEHLRQLATDAEARAHTARQNMRKAQMVADQHNHVSRIRAFGSTIMPMSSLKSFGTLTTNVPIRTSDLTDQAIQSCKDRQQSRSQSFHSLVNASTQSVVRSSATVERTERRLTSNLMPHNQPSSDECETHSTHARVSRSVSGDNVQQGPLVRIAHDNTSLESSHTRFTDRSDDMSATRQADTRADRASTLRENQGSVRKEESTVALLLGSTSATTHNFQLEDVPEQTNRYKRSDHVPEIAFEPARNDYGTYSGDRHFKTATETHSSHVERAHDVTPRDARSELEDALADHVRRQGNTHECIDQSNSMPSLIPADMRSTYSQKASTQPSTEVHMERIENADCVLQSSEVGKPRAASQKISESDESGAHSLSSNTSSSTSCQVIDASDLAPERPQRKKGSHVSFADGGQEPGTTTRFGSPQPVYNCILGQRIPDSDGTTPKNDIAARLPEAALTPTQHSRTSHESPLDGATTFGCMVSPAADHSSSASATSRSYKPAFAPSGQRTNMERRKLIVSTHTNQHPTKQDSFPGFASDPARYGFAIFDSSLNPRLLETSQAAEQLSPMLRDTTSSLPILDPHLLESAIALHRDSKKEAEHFEEKAAHAHALLEDAAAEWYSLAEKELQLAAKRDRVCAAEAEQMTRRQLRQNVLQRLSAKEGELAQRVLSRWHVESVYGRIRREKQTLLALFCQFAERIQQRLRNWRCRNFAFTLWREVVRTTLPDAAELNTGKSYQASIDGVHELLSKSSDAHLVRRALVAWWRHLSHQRLARVRANWNEDIKTSTAQLTDQRDAFEHTQSILQAQLDAHLAEIHTLTREIDVKDESLVRLQKLLHDKKNAEARADVHATRDELQVWHGKSGHDERAKTLVSCEDTAGSLGQLLATGLAELDQATAERRLQCHTGESGKRAAPPEAGPAQRDRIDALLASITRPERGHKDVRGGKEEIGSSQTHMGDQDVELASIDSNTWRTRQIDGNRRYDLEFRKKEARAKAKTQEVEAKLRSLKKLHSQCPTPELSRRIQDLETVKDTLLRKLCTLGDKHKGGRAVLSPPHRPERRIQPMVAISEQQQDPVQQELPQRPSPLTSPCTTHATGVPQKPVWSTSPVTHKQTFAHVSASQRRDAPTTLSLAGRSHSPRLEGTHGSHSPPLREDRGAKEEVIGDEGGGDSPHPSHAPVLHTLEPPHRPIQNKNPSPPSVESAFRSGADDGDNLSALVNTTNGKAFPRTSPAVMRHGDTRRADRPSPPRLERLRALAQWQEQQQQQLLSPSADTADTSSILPARGNMLRYFAPQEAGHTQQPRNDERTTSQQLNAAATEARTRIDAKLVAKELESTRDIGARMRVQLLTAQDRLQYTENSMSYVRRQALCDEKKRSSAWAPGTAASSTVERRLDVLRDRSPVSGRHGVIEIDRSMATRPSRGVPTLGVHAPVQRVRTLSPPFREHPLPMEKPPLHHQLAHSRSLRSSDPAPPALTNAPYANIARIDASSTRVLCPHEVDSWAHRTAARTRSPKTASVEHASRPATRGQKWMNAPSLL